VQIDFFPFGGTQSLSEQEGTGFGFVCARGSPRTWSFS
jgi:hypothetical protein